MLHEIGLVVPEGAIYALVGPNGAGKTTMIKLLMNILRPTAGGAQVLGLDSQRLEGEVFNRIGYVSENQEMPEAMTVGALLDYMRPFYPRWDREVERATGAAVRSAAYAQAEALVARHEDEDGVCDIAGLPSVANRAG